MVRTRSVTLLLLASLLAATAPSACGDDDGATTTPDTGPAPDRDTGPGPDDGGRPDGGPGSDAGPALEPLDCEVAIVGGGPGGLHTAFRLAPELGEGVCLFEKEAVLGGRYHDEPMDEDDPDSPVFGAGALRVMEGQDVLFMLAEELGVTLETPAVTQDLISARGLFAFGKDAFAPSYPGLTLDPDGDDHESYLYDQLRFGPLRARAQELPDFRSYVREAVGTEGWQFLHDMSRFRADFEYPLDARGYLDYLDEEWDVCCTPSYPVGGMTAFARGMTAAATAEGARIFTSEPVRELRSATEGYELVTDLHLVHANRVVIAAPPSGFDHVTGDLAEAIHAQPQYQDLIGVKVATIAQWWPNAWWREIRNPAAMEDSTVWRAWTTEHCVNFIEIPQAPYAASQNVTRSVYDDDLNCVNFWEQVAARGNAAVEEEIQRGLELLFVGNGVSTPETVTIPRPLRTEVEIWQAAWYWLRAGTTFTNADIFDWALEPLPGEEVALVGEAYNPQRSGWSDAAYKSSIHLLNTRYGMMLPTTRGMGIRTRASVRRHRSEGGH